MRRRAAEMWQWLRGQGPSGYGHELHSFIVQDWKLLGYNQSGSDVCPALTGLLLYSRQASRSTKGRDRLLPL